MTLRMINSWCSQLSQKITLEDLIRIFGEDIIPSEIDRKILMKHFDVGVNRIIGDKSIDKVKAVLLSAIEAAKKVQFKDRGGVISSPAARLAPKITAKVEGVQAEKEADTQQSDRYGLNSIRKGFVSRRLEEKVSPFEEDDSIGIERSEPMDKGTVSNKVGSEIEKDSMIPSVEDLTVLSGGQRKRIDLDSDNANLAGHVQREISIRDYKVQDEGRSVRWGKDKITDRKGELQEINHPSYIFHSDLWQIEVARSINAEHRCDILQHVVLDMVANNINVVMLEHEAEPFFVVEGHGLLYSKETLKDKVRIRELIQLMIISSDAWQIALRRPESMIKGKDAQGKEKTHAIDMTSVIPLADIRNKIIGLDNQFKASYHQPDQIIKKTLQELQKHRKNVIWTCGSKLIDNLRSAINEHRQLIENPNQTLNVVIVGTEQAFHPMKIKYKLSGEISFQELFPGYCKKHQILSDISLKNIFGSIPAIYDTHGIESWESEIPKIAHAVYQRLGFSAIENHFDLGYIKGNPSDMLPIGKMDIILPLIEDELQEKLEKKGFYFD